MAAITQPITVNVFGNANRQPGTYLTASAAIPEGVYSLGIADTMTDTVASDPANSFILTLFVSPDGTTWQAIHREQWQGGTFVYKQTGVPVPRHIKMAWSNSTLASGAWTGWVARAELDQPVTLRAGFDVTVYPPGFGPS